MLAIGILAMCLVGILAWVGLRRAGAVRVTGGIGKAPAGTAPGGDLPLEGDKECAEDGKERAEVGAVPVEIEMARLEAAGEAAAQRLWRLAFVVPAKSAASAAAPSAVSATSVTADSVARERILAALTDNLNSASLPRRPTLMPQLMQAVNDPAAASERISRIMAHDPVLTADVLRLANSSGYRTSPAPVETIHRAIVVCGIDSLRGMLATALLRPVFKATRGNFPRFPRLLWERTEGAARAAELYALQIQSPDRFEAQILVLLRALGPLAVYTAALDVYSRSPALVPNPTLCAELVGAMGPLMSLRIARDWQMSERLLEVLEGATQRPLACALHLGEFLSTLELLESHSVIASEQRNEMVAQAGLSARSIDPIVTALGRSGRQAMAS